MTFRRSAGLCFAVYLVFLVVTLLMRWHRHHVTRQSDDSNSVFDVEFPDVVIGGWTVPQYEIGLALLLYVPQYWFVKLLWRGLDFYLPPPPPTTFDDQFATIWLWFAVKEDVQRLLCCCTRGQVRVLQ